MRTLTIITLAMLALSTMAQKPTKSCGKNCMTCEVGICLACWGRTIILGKCSPIAPPASQNCQVYLANGKICGICKPGYATNVEKQGVCEAGAIDNCMSAFDLGKGARCGICKGGYPTADHTKCGGWSAEGTFGLTQSPSKNCDWGMREGSLTNCFKCSDGFVNIGGGCVKTPENLEGCLLGDLLQKSCLQCDSWNGYFMLEDNGKCTKSSDGEARNVDFGQSMEILKQLARGQFPKF